MQVLSLESRAAEDPGRCAARGCADAPTPACSAAGQAGHSSSRKVGAKIAPRRKHGHGGGGRR